MKKIFLCCLFIFGTTQLILSQTDSVKTDSLGWYRGGFTSLHFSQTGYSNWVQGGGSSLTLTAMVDLYYKFIGKNNYWENNLNLAYGLQKESKDAKIKKNEDRLEIISTYGKKAFSKFYYSGLIDFKTQFADGYNYPNDTVPISKFMSPGYLSAGVGLTWKPTQTFALFFSPATGRFVFVLNQSIADKGSFGGDSASYDQFGIKIQDGRRVYTQFGASMYALFKIEAFENVTYSSKLILFNNYTDPVASKRANIDVDWQNAVNMKINDFLSASVYTHLIYDDDIDVPIYENIFGVETQTGTGKRIQFKEVIGVGFSMNF